MWLVASNILCLLEIYCFEVGLPCDYKLTVPGGAKGGHERKHGGLVASPGGALAISKLGGIFGGDGELSWWKIIMIIVSIVSILMCICKFCNCDDEKEKSNVVVAFSKAGPRMA